MTRERLYGVLEASVQAGMSTSTLRRYVQLWEDEFLDLPRDINGSILLSFSLVRCFSDVFNARGDAAASVAAEIVSRSGSSETLLEIAGEYYSATPRHQDLRDFSVLLLMRAVRSAQSEREATFEALKGEVAALREDVEFLDRWRSDAHEVGYKLFSDINALARLAARTITPDDLNKP